MERPLPGGITWTIAGERLAVLAWPRAILLQLAHPLVAAGVARHSGFRASTLAPFTRLHATIGAMRELVFGSDDAAAATVRRIMQVDLRVAVQVVDVQARQPAFAGVERDGRRQRRRATGRRDGLAHRAGRVRLPNARCWNQTGPTKSRCFRPGSSVTVISPDVAPPLTAAWKR